jgi:uncharacterized protein YciI
MKKSMFFLMFIFLTTCLRAESFVFVFLNPKADKAELPKEEVDKLMNGHLGNIKRLAKEGKLIAAGPFDGGGGIFIFKSNSKAEVEGWLESDPAVKAKRWNIEIFSYQPRIGSVCAVGEKYEMVSYTFVRYEINQTKYTLTNLADQLREHELYVKKLSSSGNVIEEGTFGGDEGSILVMKGDVQKEVIERDPAVQKEFIGAAIKKLNIARGAFCEK